MALKSVLGARSKDRAPFVFGLVGRPSERHRTRMAAKSFARKRPLKLATWNINSVRLRQASVARFVSEADVDVLCLQETKCANEVFPLEAFRAMGFTHIELQGQPGWHGVAIASKVPIERVTAPAHCFRGEPRVMAVMVEGIELHNLYVPAGGDIPDPEQNPRFHHKLDYLDKMTEHYSKRARKKNAPPLIIVGDLNVAPLEHDVWSHKQLLNVVSHTPAETSRFLAVRDEGKFTDVVRAVMPEPERVFTWWSYRSPDWTKNNRGRRLDHIWATGAAAEAATLQGRDGIAIHAPCRSWDLPSDHVPVTANLVL
jgi:exodeoxyribonuclease-3